VAISNDRLVSVVADRVRFRSTGLTAGRWKDSARGNRVRTMTLSAAEFLARFLLHVLPAGFVRIRHFGLLASRTRTAKLARCRELLGQAPAPPPGPPESLAALMQRLSGMDIARCPMCRQGRLRGPGRLRAGPMPGPGPGHTS